MVRWLVLWGIGLSLALGQSINCDASVVNFDFSSPLNQSRVVGGQSYFQAGLPPYLALLEGSAAQLFLPTFTSGPGEHRVQCQTNMPIFYYFLCVFFGPCYINIAASAVNLPSPLGLNRVYIQGEVLSGNLVSLAPQPVPLTSLSGGRLFRFTGPGTGRVAVHLFVQMDPNDAYTGPYLASFQLTYSLP